MAAIEVGDLRKVFNDDTVAVDGVSFVVKEGEVVSLLGPSGCGKTTTLRCLAGLEFPDQGSITIGGKQMVGPGMRPVAPEERGLSMVFQQYALWPHMSVLENVIFGLSVRKRPKQEIAESAQRALQMVKLWSYRDRSISQLSGGQQQRVALARALAFDPQVVLFDEPLSNLDAKLREEMRIELIELQRRLGFAALYVTHDQEEAISLSDRVIVMSAGRIEQSGPPEEVWGAPRTAFVAEFIGESNKLEGTLRETDTPGDSWCLETDSGLKLAVRSTVDAVAGDRVDAYINFDTVALTHDRPSTGANTMQGRIKLTSFQGYSILAKVDVGPAEVMARLGSRSRSDFPEDKSVWVTIPPDAVTCFVQLRDAGGHESPQ